MLIIAENGSIHKNILITPDTTKIIMNAKDILTLHDAGVARHVAENRIIRITGTSIKYVYLLRKGVMKISNVNDEGDEVIKYFIKPGSLFGELNLLDHEENRYEMAIALEESEVSFIPAETVNQLMIADNELRKSINQSISKRIKKMEDRMFSLMLRSVKDRVMDFLREFVLEFGHPIEGGYSVKNFLTHEDIAGIAATSRQSVTTAMRDFKKRGWIDYDSRHLSVFAWEHS